MLQEQIDTATGGVESVGGEDGINIKTEEDCIEFVSTIKTEPEVSVL
jgi:hypothetical protein